MEKVKSPNVNIKCPLLIPTTDAKGKTINIASVSEIFKRNNFKEFSYPVYLDSVIATGNSTYKGVKPIGYVKSYDVDTSTFDVDIYPKFADALQTLSNKSIKPKMIIDKEGNAKIIIQLEIFSADE